ncbi:MAG: hypothetical protein IJ899_05735 [Blautia sp.]|nr:hypothetical protein [Blautia sp.]
MRPDLWNYQADRQMKYPEDRICFLDSRQAADRDKSVMIAYADGKIRKKTALKMLAESNYLDEISDIQLETEMKLLGYREEKT